MLIITGKRVTILDRKLKESKQTIKIACEKVPKRKRGPQPLNHEAKRPRGAGLISRREFRMGMNLTKATADAYRAGFNCMWKHASKYMQRKGIPRPGEFRKDNPHGGKLWGSRKECKLTDHMAGNIIERVYESGKVGLDQLKQVRHSMSYAYYEALSNNGRETTDHRS